ncbi:helicase-related protein [Streptomyces sp. NPDC088801]|uniref:helicase-related protein n=1 Tax=Streptomyces sp. NPDC088801 TaxID=3365903 RepID=UPI00382E7ABB
MEVTVNSQPPPSRGTATTHSWTAGCKDCRNATRNEEVFEYSGEWSDRVLERGGSRSDRCPRHRREHRDAIRAIAVPYVDLAVLGSVADPADPRGPLGGLGPLPTTHEEKSVGVALSDHEFGLEDRHILNLLDGLADHPGRVTKRVAVLEAGTGTGKSTFAPLRLMYPPDGAALRLTDTGPIVVTEPRIPAATGLASFVGEALCYGHDPDCGRHTGPGFPVGFQTSGNQHWDDACRLIYVTDGTMINWIRDGRLARIGAVIVDEAHERSENIDLILALLREQLPRYPRLRVIIASATIDKDFFVEYFGGHGRVHHLPVPAVKSFGYGIPFFPDLALDAAILAEGMDDGLDGRFAGFDDTVLDGSGQTVHEHALHLAALRPTTAVDLREWIERPSPDAEKRVSAAVAEQALRVLDGTEAGDILCFLPKSRMIDAAVAAIQDGIDERNPGDGTIRVHPLLASTDDRIKKQALARSKPGQRKIVVSSNLAETSLTVRGVRYIIDSGLICQSEWDPALAKGDIVTRQHSRSGARQRWGRVGRDAPGFVFPLYDHEQFLRVMPRNTPPESTRTNLEQFVLRLKSADVDDPAAMTLPANFTHEDYEPDAHGRRSATLFTTELARARTALTASGAFDTEGNLTALGRELERAEGSAQRAVAIMLADRLTCLHEVAAALHLLDGPLTGRSGLFRFDLSWPAAWRAHAYSCHRALAVGCGDDLELVLRVFSAWQNAENREEWARTWWLDHDVLVAAENRVKETVGGLSSHMKKSADRSVDLRLLGRARGVLSRAYAMTGFTFGNSGEAWTDAQDPGKTVTLAPFQLTRPEGRVVAFRRTRPLDRTAAGGEGDGRETVIGQLLSIARWAVEGSPDPFALLERTSRHAPPLAESADRRTLDLLREALPVGVVVDTSSGRPRAVSAPLPYPGDSAQPAEARTDGSRTRQPKRGKRVRTAVQGCGRSGGTPGANRSAQSDIEVNVPLGPVPQGEVPEEETALALTALEETNDEGPAAEWPEDRETDAGPRGGFPDGVLLRWTGDPELYDVADEHGWYDQCLGKVAGYDLADGQVTLLLEPLKEAGAASLGLDERFGTELTLRAGGWTRDYLDEFRVLWAADGRRFLLHPQTRGLGARQVDLPGMLARDTEVAWTVVPGPRDRDPAELSPLPALRRALSRARTTPDGWYPALLEPADDRQDGTGPLIRLTLPGRDTGLSALTVSPRLIEGLAARDTYAENGMTGEPAKTREVEVRLGSEKDPSLTWQGNPAALTRLVSAHAAFLRLDGARTLKPTTDTLPRATVDGLLRADDDNGWQRRVWRFWLESQRLGVREVRVTGSSDVVPAPPWLHEAWPSAARKKWAEQFGLDRLVSRPAEITLVGPPAAVESARAELADAQAWAGVRIEVDPAVIGRVRGRQSRYLDELLALPDVLACEMRGNSLVLIGRRRAALVPAVTRVLRKARIVDAVITLDPAFRGRPILNGTERRSLLTLSGCTFLRQREADPVLEATASDIGQIRVLVELIRQRVDRWADLSTADVHSVQSTDLATGRAWEHTEYEATDPFRDFRPPPVSTARRPSPRGPQLRPSAGSGSTPPVPVPPIEQEGPTTEQAVRAGLARLGLTSDQVSIEVLREARYSFFRKILQETALVRLTPRSTR